MEKLPNRGPLPDLRVKKRLFEETVMSELRPEDEQGGSGRGEGSEPSALALWVFVFPEL